MPKAVATALATEPNTKFRDAVHLITQKKGGIGKSAVSQFVGEYLSVKYGDATCFDTDPSQPTFARVSDLNVQRVPILKNDEIDPMLINPMLNTIMDNPGPFVIDTGSSSYHALWNYIVGAELFTLLQENDRPVVVHIPLAAKPDFEDTIAGFDEISAYCPPRSVVAWINEREYPIEMDGKSFFDLDAARKHQEKLLGVVANVTQRDKWNRSIMNEMLAKKYTFRQSERECDRVTVTYLRRVRSEVFGQLEAIGL